MRYLKPEKEQPGTLTNNELVSRSLSSDLQFNIDTLKQLLQNCSDAVLKEINFGTRFEKRGLLVYFDGLVDRNEIESNLLKSLQLDLNMLNSPPTMGHTDIFKMVQESLLSLAEVHPVEGFEEICRHISSGDTVFLIDGCDKGLAAGTRSWQCRSVQTPESEVVIRGPKEGFTETLRFNTALLRRRLKSNRFKMVSFTLGRITRTDVVLCYIEDIVSSQLLETVTSRINKIDIDGVLDSGYLEEYLEDSHFTIFSQLEYTEKPDRVCGHLLEGRVCILVDGSPEALIAPTSFPRFYIAAEDYYERFISSSLLRLLRFLAFWIALLLPSIYVSLITYHQEMIPTALYLTILSSVEGVPFPAFVEALILETTFEMLREAGVRLPRSVGPAVSIVGALIIGDAAVKAGLVSTPMVVVVAFTGIASFVTPAYNAGIAVRIARFGFLIASALMGLFGVMIALIFMLIHMASINSFGLPYLSPVAPADKDQWGDTLVRRPWYTNRKTRLRNPSRQEVNRDGESN